MRKLILGLVLLGATALAGCANHHAWNHDSTGWAIQSWDTEPLFTTTRSCRLAPGLMGVVVVDTRFHQEACCDQEVSTNSWGPRAAMCGGRKSALIARKGPDGQVRYEEGSYKPAPYPVASSAPSPRSTPIATGGMSRVVR